jgi:hypothetical protein
MKKSVFIFLVILIAAWDYGFSQDKNRRYLTIADTMSVDSLEYELIILDPGFEVWLASQPSKEFYSNDYYARRNRLYVMEWNHRYIMPQNNGRYETYIDYNPQIDYGLDLNYKLYYYFKYFEETNHVRLLNTAS